MPAKNGKTSKKTARKHEPKYRAIEKRKFQLLRVEDEQVEAFEKNMTLGVDIQTACSLAQIPVSTLYYYKQKAERIYKAKSGKDEALTDYEKELICLLEVIKKSKAEAIKRNVAIVQQAAMKQWQAAAWWLERTEPEKYGRRIIDNRHSGAVGTYKIIPAKDPDKIEVNEN